MLLYSYGRSNSIVKIKLFTWLVLLIAHPPSGTKFVESILEEFRMGCVSASSLALAREHATEDPASSPPEGRGTWTPLEPCHGSLQQEKMCHVMSCLWFCDFLLQQADFGIQVLLCSCLLYVFPFRFEWIFHAGWCGSNKRYPGVICKQDICVNIRYVLTLNNVSGLPYALYIVGLLPWEMG